MSVVHASEQSSVIWESPDKLFKKEGGHVYLNIHALLTLHDLHRPDITVMADWA